MVIIIMVYHMVKVYIILNNKNILVNGIKDVKYIIYYIYLSMELVFINKIQVIII